MKIYLTEIAEPVEIVFKNKIRKNNNHKDAKNKNIKNPRRLCGKK